MGFAPSMAFRRGLLSKAMDLLLRLFALKSVRLPTTSLADMSIEIWISSGVLVTAANNQVLTCDCSVVVKLAYEDSSVLRCGVSPITGRISW